MGSLSYAIYSNTQEVKQHYGFVISAHPVTVSVPLKSNMLSCYCVMEWGAVNGSAPNFIQSPYLFLIPLKT